MKFYECNKCGNVMVLYEDSGVVPVCCGSAMEELKPQCEDGPKEKHVPVIKQEGCEVTVTVGDILHPMEENHYIKWIVLETDKGQYIKCLKPNMDPIAKFTVCDNEKILAAYEFCNIHSLWINNYEK